MPNYILRSFQPKKSQEKGKERKRVERFSEPRPKRPPSDSRGELQRCRGIKRHLLERKHLGDEEEAAPDAHDDIRAKSYEVNHDAIDTLEAPSSPPLQWIHHRAFPPQHKGHDSGSRAPSCQLLMSIGNKLTTPRRVQAAPLM
jgi:hypothetical protein